MSTLQVANIHLESTQNNRIQYLGSNNIAIFAGGANVITSDTVSVNVYTNKLNFVSANVSTNTFNLGSFSNATSGFTVLPNLMKINWGTASPNSIGSNTVTFASAFTTNTYGVSLTILGSAANAGLANAKMAFVSSISNSGFTINTANNNQSVNTGVTAVYYMVIGPA